jgi:hypothetical protein
MRRRRSSGPKNTEQQPSAAAWRRLHHQNGVPLRTLCDKRSRGSNSACGVAWRRYREAADGAVCWRCSTSRTAGWRGRARALMAASQHDGKARRSSETTRVAWASRTGSSASAPRPAATTAEGGTRAAADRRRLGGADGDVQAALRESRRCGAAAGGRRRWGRAAELGGV